MIRKTLQSFFTHEYAIVEDIPVTFEGGTNTHASTKSVCYVRPRPSDSDAIKTKLPYPGSKSKFIAEWGKLKFHVFRKYV